MTPGRKLRDAWNQQCLQIPGVFNALVARMAEQMGFPAAYLSGGALSASHGVPDVGLLTLNDFLDAARSITRATSLPLISDADTGFGEALNVERTVHLFEEANVAGIHLEDQRLPKRCGHLSGKQLVEPQEMTAKIRAAVAAKQDSDFIIIARTDARGVTSFEDAVERAKMYVDAGADVIFPEAMRSPEEFETFVKAVPVPTLANMTEFGQSPILTVEELAQMGYKLVIYPLTAFRVAIKSAQETLQAIQQQGHQREKVEQMLTRQELYDLLGYSNYEARDREYFQ